MIKFNREWAMPSGSTFSIKPISKLLDRYCKENMIIIDPFALNAKRGTITNDLDPEASAMYHMDAEVFLDKLIGDNVAADLVLLDPPYSPRQINELYKHVNIDKSIWTNSQVISVVKRKLGSLCKKGGLAISFGWNTGGLGKVNGFEIEEILIVPHGGWHNDTLVTVERKNGKN